MLEVVKMGNNCEGKGRNRDGKADRNGVFENVFRKLVFDAVGVFLESEDESRKADTGEV